MVRIFPIIALAIMASVSFADTVVIENFENDSDPASWQLKVAANQTLNATASGDVPVFLQESPSNKVGQFNVQWTIPATETATTNVYDASPTTTYWAARFNINAPGSLPNNQLPTADAVLKADVTNNSPYAVYISLVVDSLASSELERGPLVLVDGNSSTTYSWDFAAVPPVGFDTGDDVFSGPTQRVKSLLVYTTTQPTSSGLDLRIDNIRNTNSPDLVPPVAPKTISFLQTSVIGEALVKWEASPSSDVDSYNIYVATDSNFGSPITNRLTFPDDPETTVSASATAKLLTGLPTNQNIYVAVSATDNSSAANESPLSQALAINLKNNGTLLTDRIVLDNDEFQPEDAGFISNGYFHGVVYTAQALSGIGRHFETVTDEAITSGLVLLEPDPSGLVVWSNLQDGATGDALTPAAQTKIADFLSGDCNLIISGTNLAQSAGTTSGSLEALFHTSLVIGAAGVSDITPSAELSPAVAVSTGLNPSANSVAYSTTANDGILPVNEAVALAAYNGIPETSAVAATGLYGKVVVLGFAFESAGSPAGPAASKAARQNLMQGMSDYLFSTTAAHDWQLFD